jgi:hypothetical protein
MSTLAYIMRETKGMEGILGNNREEIRIILDRLPSNQLRT